MVPLSRGEDPRKQGGGRGVWGRGHDCEALGVGGLNEVQHLSRGDAGSMLSFIYSIDTSVTILRINGNRCLAYLILSYTVGCLRNGWRSQLLWIFFPFLFNLMGHVMDNPAEQPVAGDRGAALSAAGLTARHRLHRVRFLCHLGLLQSHVTQSFLRLLSDRKQSSSVVRQAFSHFQSFLHFFYFWGVIPTPTTLPLAGVAASE